MFNTMMDGIKEESVGSLFNLQVQVQPDPIVAEGDGEAGPAVITTLPSGPAVPPAQAGPALPQAGPAAAGGEGKHRQGARRPARPRPTAAPAQDDAAVPAALAAPGLARPRRAGQLNYTAPSEDATGTAEQRTTAAGEADFSRVGRNAPCPCGSGKKFKQCHGDPRNVR